MSRSISGSMRCLSGWADETISSRAYRKSLKGDRYFMDVIDSIFFWHPDHCQKSYESEKIRNQLPPELRTLEDKT